MYICIYIGIFEILRLYSENIVGVYFYSSYESIERMIDLDIDILVVANDKIKIIEKIDNYHIISATINDLENTVKNNAVLILPVIKEAKTIINPDLLDKYKNYRFTRKNTKRFLGNTKKFFYWTKKC